MTGYVFDLGGVLTKCKQTKRIRELSEKYALDLSRLEFKKTDLKKLDDGKITREQLYRNAFPELDDEALNSVSAAHLESYFNVNDVVAERMKRLHKAGRKLAVISSIGKKNAGIARRIFSDVFKLCDCVLFSCDVGFEKPSKKMIEEVRARLGLPIESLTFVDDDDECLAVAKSLGAKIEKYKVG